MKQYPCDKCEYRNICAYFKKDICPIGKFKYTMNSMERNITITLEKAKEWYNSDNESLKEAALQAFSEEELAYNFRDITTFKKACEVLNIHYAITSIIIKDIARVSRASAAMFKLNIIRKALNLDQDLHLTKDPKDSCIYYPHNPFVTESSVYCKDKIESGKIEIIGKIKSKGTLYNVLSGCPSCCGGAGLGAFLSVIGVGNSNTDIGFLGCVSEEIAQHFGKYFGMLITEAKYGDMVDFEIVENKYQ